MSKPKVSYRDISNGVKSVMIIRHDNNNMIDRIGVVYVENKMEQSWSTMTGIICDENQTKQ